MIATRTLLTTALLNRFGASLVFALCLLQGSVWAEGNRRYGNDNRNNDNGSYGQCGRGDRDCERQRPRELDRNDNQHGARGPGRFDDERGAGPGHSFYRGDRLPNEYRGNRYVVDDWHGHGLRAPPRGYHWVQTGGDYVLVAIATGVILELLLSR
jgi:Ni/Co efflux regulator RcnB